MKFNFEATGIGSVPFEDEKEACSIILENFPEIPFWPQLPKRSYLESMYAQFSERIPGLVLDKDAKTIHIDTSRVAGEIEEVYGKYLDGDVNFFKISEDHAKGFYRFLDSFKGGAKFVKGHITGPVSFALTLTDQNKRSIIYDKDLFEVLVKVLCMKARWQIKKLKERSPNVIIFIDEPYLVSIGSSFVNIDAASAMARLDEVADVIRKEGCLAGVHCCGNTDWQMLLERKVDILNFDAYNFAKEFLLYAGAIKKFLNSGGAIAWGIVPSSETALTENAKGLARLMKDSLKALQDKGVEGDVSSLVTSSCGAGTLGKDNAKKIFRLAAELSGELKKTKA